jgi:hypothetical protein
MGEGEWRDPSKGMNLLCVEREEGFLFIYGFRGVLSRGRGKLLPLLLDRGGPKKD